MSEVFGYGWLAKRFGIRTVAPLTASSSTGRAPSRSEDDDGFVVQVLRADRADKESVRWHLAQALKHEGVHLEFLARLFAKLDPAEIGRWNADEPTGALARRAGFLYEWLTGRRIEGHEAVTGNYVDALDSEKYLVASHPQPNRRWRVMDNLPGTSRFCPTVRLTMATRLARLGVEIECREVGRLMADFGEGTILRAANWLSIKESKASFAIEREGDRNERIRRFAAAMIQHCGRMEDPLTPQALAVLQRAILADQNTVSDFGLRRSPAFVGRTIRYEPVVDYLAPHFDQVPGMLEGLGEFARRTAGGSSIARAALLSFGFVYIHPLSDGNGRISRFLINDTLRRDGVVPAPLILPVSSVIQASMKRYDNVLESVSSPLMQEASDVSFAGESSTCEDGVRTNLVFNRWDDLAPSWRFMDMTGHVRYISDVLRLTMSQEMRHEAAYLRDFDRARQAVREIIDGPDQDIDRIVTAIHETGRASGKLRKEFPRVFSSAHGTEIERAVLDAFSPEGDGEGVARRRGDVPAGG